MNDEEDFALKMKYSLRLFCLVFLLIIALNISTQLLIVPGFKSTSLKDASYTYLPDKEIIDNLKKSPLRFSILEPHLATS